MIIDFLVGDTITTANLRQNAADLRDGCLGEVIGCNCFGKSRAIQRTAACSIKLNVRRQQPTHDRIVERAVHSAGRCHEKRVSETKRWGVVYMYTVATYSDGAD